MTHACCVDGGSSDSYGSSEELTDEVKRFEGKTLAEAIDKAREDEEKSWKK